MKVYDVMIIGGGAAGLAAAAKGGPGWILAEKNDRPAKKIYATGNGRCNYMNMKAGAAAGPAGAGALRSALEAFGISGREEEDGRVYPRSGKAEDVALALIGAAQRSGCTIVTEFEAASAAKDGDVFTVTARDGRVLKAQKLLIASGGKAGIQYGSDGAGLKLAKAFGHDVVKPIPALTRLEVSDPDFADIAGVRVNGRVSLVKDTDGLSLPLASDSGEIQFAKNGVSGICTMNLSRFYRIEEGSSFFLLADLFEDYDLNALKGLFSARRAAFGDEDAEFIFDCLIPRKLGDFILRRCGVKPGLKLSLLSDRELALIAVCCKLLRFSVSGAGGWKDAQVTCGGVELSQVDLETMESKLVPGLYFAGEVLNYDGPCGGYNLSWAFSTGLRAGEAMK